MAEHALVGVGVGGGGGGGGGGVSEIAARHAPEDGGCPPGGRTRGAGTPAAVCGVAASTRVPSLAEGRRAAGVEPQESALRLGGTGQRPLDTP
ncbi:hypothetical protein [Streptomyces sp. NPDC005302]|uniref:hypothetical protein n=1 Tax=Streptomyces sp. NPDC005302 TaxID=3154675 RepID=UPI0033A3EB95